MASYLDKTGLTYFWSKIKTYVTNAVKVTGVKGAAENSYRTGNVNLTAANVNAYAIGPVQLHKGSSVSADPQTAITAAPKGTSEYEFIKPLAGIGDWFYCADVNPEFTITSNYSEGTHGTKGSFYKSTLFNPSASSTIRLDVSTIAQTPFVLTVEKTATGNITATDVVHLELWGHTIGDSGARLTDYKVELLTTGSTSSTGEYSWQTVYERTNASDKINGLSICLNPTSYAYLYFRGVRFTISGATPGSTNPNAWNYNCIDISLFRLIDQRPAFSTARAIGALDLRGGTVFGPTTFSSNVTVSGTLTGSLNGNASSATNASKVNNHTVNSDVPSNAKFTDTTYSEATQSTAGLMSAADKTALDSLAGGTVSDVQVNGTSVVSNSIADIPLASSSANGVMSSSQYTKLDGIEAGAEVNTVTDVQLNGTSVLSNGVANIPPASSASHGYMTIASYNNLNSLRSILSATTSTAAGTAEKVLTVSPSSFALNSGTLLLVKSTYTNSASNPKFKLGSSSTAPSQAVYYNNSAATGNKAGMANRLSLYIYYNNVWNWIGWSYEQDTTYSTATTSTSGLMSSSDKTKLNGIATGAEVNQNAFSTITVGETTVSAASKTDGVELVAGSNVTLTPDATNKTITIAATDTTYSAMSSSDIITGTSETAMIATPKAIHDAIASMISTALGNMLEVNDPPPSE